MKSVFFYHNQVICFCGDLKFEGVQFSDLFCYDTALGNFLQVKPMRRTKTVKNDASYIIFVGRSQHGIAYSNSLYV